MILFTAQGKKEVSLKKLRNRSFNIEPSIRWEFIYDQINGLNESDVCEWVKDETDADGELGVLIDQIYEARERICDRLGVEAYEDCDLGQMVDKYDEFCRICGKLMYYYGHLDGVNGM